MNNQNDIQALRDTKTGLHASYTINKQLLEEKKRIAESTISDPLYRSQRVVLLKALEVQNNAVSSDFELYFRLIEQGLTHTDHTFEALTDGKLEQKVEQFQKELERLHTKIIS